jgi:hypothetical protein
LSYSNEVKCIAERLEIHEPDLRTLGKCGYLETLLGIEAEARNYPSS